MTWVRAGTCAVTLAVTLVPVLAQTVGAETDPPPQPPSGAATEQRASGEEQFPVPQSGSGRRIVYSNSQQRVWLVEDDGSVARSYLVSGRHRFPRPGSFRVLSKSRHSRLGSVRFEYMVRFAPTRRLTVGFHSIPVGRRGLIQSEGDLGRPRSRGCVRQRLADAAFLWDWAPVGTRVILTP